MFDILVNIDRMLGFGYFLDILVGSLLCIGFCRDSLDLGGMIYRGFMIGMLNMGLDMVHMTSRLN